MVKSKEDSTAQFGSEGKKTHVFANKFSCYNIPPYIFLFLKINR